MKKSVQNLGVSLLLLLVVSSNACAQDQLNVLIELSNATSMDDSIVIAGSYGFKQKKYSEGTFYKNKQSFIENIDGHLCMWIPYSPDRYKSLKKELDLSYFLWNIAPEKNVILSEFQYEYSFDYILTLYLDWFGRKRYIFLVLAKP